MKTSFEPLDSPFDLPRSNEETDRYAHMVDAAYDILGEDGLEGLTVRALLKRTGLARRAFYEHFVGKDDLMLAVLQMMLRRAAHHFESMFDDRESPLDRLRFFVVGIATGPMAKNGDDGKRVTAMVREHLRLAQTRPDKLKAVLQPLLDVISAQIGEGIRAGEVRDCDPEFHAALIYNLVATTMHSYVMLRDTDQPSHMLPERISEQLWEFCCRAIAA
jgi:AcrR family transcriptional regulator